MQSNQVTGARYLAEALHRSGVRDVFFIDAVLRRTLVEMEHLGINRVLVHAEKTAAYMADGYARVSGRLGVCMAQSVGAANLAAGLQDAYLHRSPVLALTGRKPPSHRYRNAYQEIQHGPMFSAVTKMQADIETTAQLPLLLAQAMREATSGTPRPVHLDVNGLMGEVIETGHLTDPSFPDPRTACYPAHRPRPDVSEIEAAAARLAKASKPVLVVGTGAVQAGAEAEILAFAERLDIPIATSLGGRGSIVTTHPRHIGVVGTYSAPVTNQLVHDADAVVFVGCHTSDQTTNNWTVPGPEGVAIIQIDLDASECGRNYSDVACVVGDPKAALADLLAATTARPEWAVWAQEAAGRFAAWHESMQTVCASDAAPLRTERLCYDLGESLPEDAILVADTGYSGIWTGTLVDLKYPGQTYLRAAGSLGWSFPAALGAKCAAPERPVVCFTGDGGVYYHLTELETARRRGIAVVLVINNNSGFGQSMTGVRAAYDGKAGNPDEMVRFGPTNFADVARAFGVDSIRVEEPAALRPALDRALNSAGPMVIDVVTDAEVRAPVAWGPKV